MPNTKGVAVITLILAARLTRHSSNGSRIHVLLRVAYRFLMTTIAKTFHGFDFYFRFWAGGVSVFENPLHPPRVQTRESIMGSNFLKKRCQPALFMKSATNLLSKPRLVTRADFLFIASLISEQLVDVKPGGGSRFVTVQESGIETS